ncbi:MAG: hypothetical protein QG602_79 [Verrucomicrobiota bacterium]|nr:hypothetical protein [Verrucomicrobiota bacterium]
MSQTRLRRPAGAKRLDKRGRFPLQHPDQT